MVQSSLTVERLSVRVGERRVLEGVTFAARAGELTAVIGPNGAGKTSLLEGILGVRLAEGEVRVTGNNLRAFAHRARTFAYLPDHSELPEEASVLTVVQHALGYASGSVNVDELVRLLAIDALRARGCGTLSRGERQRVSLFCTLALGRPVVVLDEPFSAFDPMQLENVRLAVRSVLATGTIILASIHQLGDAEKMADRMLLLAAGRALAFGTIAELGCQAGGTDLSLDAIFVALLSRESHAA
jgi:ABC-2 type transport system ATP-binding protein